METTEQVLLSVEQVCARLNVSRQTLTNWRSLGDGPRYVKTSGEVGRRGGRVEYPEEAVEEFRAARRRAGRPVRGRPWARRENRPGATP